LGERQLLPAGSTASGGQNAFDPVHTSVTSQTSPDELARQTVPAGSKSSGGQLGLLPVQNSTTSQLSTAARHPAVAGLKTSAGQSLPTPSQTSGASHTSAGPRQVVVFFASAGQVVLPGWHVSTASQTPAAPRHTGPGFGVAWLHEPPTHWSTEQGLPSLEHAVPLATLAQPQVPSANVVPPVHVAV
jgi:hypothetical protein